MKILITGAHGFVGKDRITSELMAEVGRVFAPDPAKDDRSTP